VTTTDDIQLDYDAMLAVAIEEARIGLAEGGVPIGAAVFDRSGALVSRGHNRRVQHGDPSSHGETDAFRNAGRQPTWRDKIIVSTLTPCWYCSGLIRQFGFPTLVVGESTNSGLGGGVGMLREIGVEVVQFETPELIEMFRLWTLANPAVWAEDAGNT
jgi:cytosine/creatinine deaminase